MPAAKAGKPAVQNEVMKALGRGYILDAAKPSGAYFKLRTKGGRTICWLMGRKDYTRCHFIAATEGAPKALLRDTWIAKGHTQLQVKDDVTLEQARKLIEWAAERTAVKATPKAKATAKPKPTAKKRAASSRSRPSKPKTPVRKRRLEWVMPSGQEMARRLPEDEVEGFIEFLKEQGAEGITLE